ncbi:uncharacterized protein LOC129729146 [Wyeomyia smithii]|uniref:uncharacterized protein LOC129729146 n=1 Tax=Wyeomyia smithii TaxID=174621 RepID=UPI00246819B6|nr:uncharacterized protein LOC129729146 [Wyeomyia smithii]
MVSRGVQPNELMRSDLWWNGPGFLRVTNDMSDPRAEDNEDDLSEEDCVVVGIVTASANGNYQYELIMACSSFRRLQRRFAYVCRFIYNCRAKGLGKKKRSGAIGVMDWRDAVYCMVRIVQRVVYYEKISNIQRGERVEGKLRNFNPFFDEQERLLRVGGRIKYSDSPRDQKQPMIIPERHHFTEIVIEALHQEELHVGLNGLMAKIRRQFWPVNAKRTINRLVRRCVKCFRANPRDVQQFMGDLPSVRVTITQPFSRMGEDYAGPFFIKQGRSKAPCKAYVCVFVCICTKAIHLELVTSLTTEGFLQALLRFVGRRGNVSDIYSDNGTNFIGAKRELQELFQLLKSQILQEKIAGFCQPRGINWHLVPPKAPHQGGLWEAGVKAMKTHLHRTLKEAYLTYEEMNTLLIKSRPY